MRPTNNGKDTLWYHYLVFPRNLIPYLSKKTHSCTNTDVHIHSTDCVKAYVFPTIYAICLNVYNSVFPPHLQPPQPDESFLFSQDFHMCLSCGMWYVYPETVNVLN